MEHFLIASAATLLVASCATAPAPMPTPTPGVACGITGATDWRAWVSAMPGPNGRPMLIATGKVTVPTGGYRFAWRDMRVMESFPVQVVAELESIPPAGGATEALVTHDVRGEWPIDPPVGAFTVRCGDMILARVSPVETAH